jgi:hypothetical protein
MPQPEQRYAPLVPDPESPGPPRVPAWLSRGLPLFDVDDTEMLQKRKWVMNLCFVQVLLSLLLVTNYRRSPVLLVMQPFFIGAGLLGYFGAKNCNALWVAGHFIGSAGLAFVFLFFILAETLLKHGLSQVQRPNADLFFIVINAPMDGYLFIASLFSAILYLSLAQLRRQLERERERIREQFEALEVNEVAGIAGVPAGIAGVELTHAGEAAEIRRRVHLPVLPPSQTVLPTHAQTRGMPASRPPPCPCSCLSQEARRQERPALPNHARSDARPGHRWGWALVRARGHRAMADGAPHLAAHRPGDAWDDPHPKPPAAAVDQRHAIRAGVANAADPAARGGGGGGRRTLVRAGRACRRADGTEPREWVLVPARCGWSHTAFGGSGCRGARSLDEAGRRAATGPVPALTLDHLDYW